MKKRRQGEERKEQRKTGNIRGREQRGVEEEEARRSRSQKKRQWMRQNKKTIKRRKR